MECGVYVCPSTGLDKCIIRVSSQQEAAFSISALHWSTQQISLEQKWLLNCTFAHMMAQKNYIFYGWIKCAERVKSLILLCHEQNHRVWLDAEGRWWYGFVHIRTGSVRDEWKVTIDICAAVNSREKSAQMWDKRWAVAEPRWKNGKWWCKMEGIERDTQNKMAEGVAVIEKVVTCD